MSEDPSNCTHWGKVQPSRESAVSVGCRQRVALLPWQVVGISGSSIELLAVLQ